MLAMTRGLMLFFPLLIAGCDRDRPPAPTAEQSDQLDEAEAMLNDMANDPGAEDEKGAAPAGTAPSNSN